MRANTPRILLVGCGLLVGLAGCGGKAYVRPGFMDHPPKRLAVLPFVITYPYDLTEHQTIPESHAIGRDLFRKTFYYAVTPYGYEDIKLADVDERLATAWGPLEAGGWRKASPQELGKALGADALVYGELDRLMHFSTPLYTETSLSGSLRMVDAHTAEVLWRKSVRVAERGGALMKKGQVVDFVQDQVRSFNPRVKFLRVADVATRRVLKGFPNPPLSASTPTQPSRPGASRVSRLALLPLEAKQPRWNQASRTLRLFLAASLQESSFEVIELQQVDAALNARGWHDGEPLPSSLPLADVAKAVGADVLLRGTVTNWGRSYVVVESWVKAELELALVDPQSGEVIWSEKKKQTRQAGLLKGPTGFQSIATGPLMGLLPSHLERVATQLTRSMTADLSTSPAVLAYVSDNAL